MMVVASGLLGIASVLASGILFRHRRVLTLLAAAAALWESGWLLLTLVHRTAFPTMNAAMIFMVGAALLLGVFLIPLRQWRWPYVTSGSGWRDVAVLGVLVPVLLSGWFIQQANGFKDTDWITHGFYNGDTATFIAFVQRSLVVPGLLDQNPFAANGPLEYPTLVHAGVAEIIAAFDPTFEWLSFLPLIVLLQGVITIPLFFLLRDAVKDIPAWPVGYRWGWRGLMLEGGVIAYVLALSWESYVYPQGHFFTTTLFMLLVTLLARSWSERGRTQAWWSVPGAVLCVLLVLSNAITGTAAAAIWCVFAALRTLDRKRSPSEQLIYGGSIVALVTFFLLHAPGAGDLSLTPWVSYTAVTSMTLVAAPAILLLLGIFTQLRHHVFIGSITIALSALSLLVFFFSDRDIVVENSSRFLYHALLVGWPLAVDSFVWNARIIKARLQQLEVWPGQVVGITSVAIIHVLLILPALASVASVHDHLLFKDKHITDVTTRVAMKWLGSTSAPDALILASPQEPWNVPLFAGRALVRADYWLSPGDPLQRDVIAAFAGDREAQARVIPEADYVVLRGAEREHWNLPSERMVEQFGDMAIYDVRK